MLVSAPVSSPLPAVAAPGLRPVRAAPGGSRRRAAVAAARSPTNVKGKPYALPLGGHTDFPLPFPLGLNISWQPPDGLIRHVHLHIRRERHTPVGVGEALIALWKSGALEPYYYAFS